MMRAPSLIAPLATETNKAMIRSKITRAMVGVMAGVGVSVFGVPAAHAGDVEACLNAADQAQQMRDDGKFRSAREQMLVCVRDVCPGPVKRDCGDWLTQLDATAPSVVLTAKEGNTDLTDVSVSMDGAVLADKLDGRPILMDLGTHTFKFSYQGQEKSESVVISAGQKMRNISVQFGGASSGPSDTDDESGEKPATTEEKRSILPYVLGGVGVAAIGSFAFFGLSGNSQKSDLENSCGVTHSCSDDDVSSVRTKYAIADISLGVGIVALGVATYLLLKPSSSSSPPASASEDTAKIRFDVGPVKGGAAGGISGTF